MIMDVIQIMLVCLLLQVDLCQFFVFICSTGTDSWNTSTWSPSESGSSLVSTALTM